MFAFVVRLWRAPALAVFFFAGLSLGACDCQQEEPALQASEQPQAAQPQGESPSPQGESDAGSIAATTPRSSSPKSGRETCRTICDTALEAGCPNYPLEQCLGECLQMTSLRMCETEMQALLGCWSTTTTDDFKCDEEGKATTRKGVCADEQTAASECMALHMAGKGAPSR